MKADHFGIMRRIVLVRQFAADGDDMGARAVVGPPEDRKAAFRQTIGKAGRQLANMLLDFGGTYTQYDFERALKCDCINVVEIADVETSCRVGKLVIKQSPLEASCPDDVFTPMRDR